SPPVFTFSQPVSGFYSLKSVLFTLVRFFLYNPAFRWLFFFSCPSLFVLRRRVRDWCVSFL
ncbi:MAG: hypothetical protein ACRDCV_03495, partial [Plesiomonas shigelloides]